MIKKAIHIIISLLLLLSISGFYISNHYCSGNLVSVTINHEAKPCCESNGCCHNETKVFQLKGNYVNSQFIFENIDTIIEIIYPAFCSILNDISDETIAVNAINESPPPLKIQTRLSIIQTYLC